ncbi:MAG: TIGR04283 family arsenosugar biosynthesis glycosyltransferase [Acidobacteria bacterium]|nr:TIGR04283 family arsenosugar biosynthesis glycosyltransferase [Acidobacteriota bacterium]
MIIQGPCEPASLPVSIIIATWNEACAIGRTLDAVARVRGLAEVIVVDGGSSDGTADMARRRGITVLMAHRGRGSQMHTGACAARGEVLWFVHADTHPPADGARQILEALADRRTVGGSFRVRFDGDSASARFMTRFYPLLWKLGLCYGDAAIFVRREAYEQADGFPDFPIFEDLDLVKRLRCQGRFARLPLDVVTSSRRFEGRSFAWTFVRWILLQILYWVGVHPGALGRFYAPIRAGNDGDAGAMPASAGSGQENSP